METNGIHLRKYDAETKVNGIQTSQDIKTSQDELPIPTDTSTLESLRAQLEAKKALIITCVKVVFLLAYLAYVGYAMSLRFGDEGSIRLLVCTVLGLTFLGWRRLKKSGINMKLPKVMHLFENKRINMVIRWIMYIAMSAFFIVYTILYSLIDQPRNLVSLAGLVILIVIMFVTSTNRSKVNWHTVFWGFMVQFICGIIFLRTEFGVNTLTYIRIRFEEFTSYSDVGAEFAFTKKYKDFDFIFMSMPRVLYFVTMINVLQYLGVISFLVRTVGRFLAFCLDTRPVESVVAASNIFMGSNEAFMTVRPYLDDISKSELFTLLVCGMASTAGSAMLVFKSFGVNMEYLLTASVMSAPAALVCAKLSMPEEDDGSVNNTTKLKLNGKDMSMSKNILEAITKGTQQGTLIVTSIVVTMIIYLSLVEFANATLSWFAERIDIHDMTLETVSSYVFWPLAYIIGIPSVDCFTIARYFGIRALTNAGIAYIQMGKLLDNRDQLTSYMTSFNDSVVMENNDVYLPMWNTTLVGGVLQERSVIVGTYALCGFSCIPVLGMTLGVFATIAPKRLTDITECIVRAFFMSTAASLCTACVAGILYVGS